MKNNEAKEIQSYTKVKKKLSQKYKGLFLQYLFYSLWLTQPGLKPTIYCTLGEHANHYTTDWVVLGLH
jgi:hypothetical protein